VVQISAFQTRAHAPRRADERDEPVVANLPAVRRVTEPATLNDSASRALFDQAWNLVAEHLLRQPLRPVEAAFTSLAGLSISGLFVTLKRQGRLRACCGTLGERLTLASALEQAARRTASEDPRLPPVSPSELAFLTLDVTLLGRFETLPPLPTERRQHVVVGRDGLRIELNGQAGLLLPQVAVEHGWDADQFLAQVCLKAGLPADAWCDPHSRLQTFTGQLISGTTPAEELQRLAARWQPRFDAQARNLLLTHCQRNLHALITGATPHYYALDCPDGDLDGLVLSLVSLETGQVHHVSQVSLRPPLPLQSTLFGLLERSIGEMRQHAWRGPIEAQLALLSDPAMHGTLAEPDLRGFDPTRRCLAARLENRYAIVRNAQHGGQVHLEWLQARVGRRGYGQTQLLSFHLENGNQPLELNCLSSANPRPVAVNQFEPRPAAVAGLFYPADEAQLAAELQQLFGDRPVDLRRARAVMVPHAGWKYSGTIAAQVLRQIEIPPSVVVIGPKHTPLGVTWAVAPCSRWDLPGRVVACDRDLATRLVEGIEGWEFDAAAHQQEHGIEVELPFLHHLNPDVQVVGVALHSADWETCHRFATQLANVLRGCEVQPLIVISSDMHHFADDATNRRLDRLALHALETLRPEHLLQTVRRERITMCGVVPAVVVMEALRQLGQLHGAECVAYGTSGDVSGDTTRVVGYAGVIFPAD
jgi:AmmeMemoRadiSam system protein B/AmmeMemoRadiSam system protein A